MAQITSIQDFADTIDEGMDPERLHKGIYKGTSCGAWITWDSESITVGSIVEGSDVDCESHTIRFPAQAQDVWSALDLIEAEAETIWEEWNNDN